jgi:hypothetical protein
MLTTGLRQRLFLDQQGKPGKQFLDSLRLIRAPAAAEATAGFPDAAARKDQGGIRQAR